MAATDPVASAPAPQRAAVQPKPVATSTAGMVRSNEGLVPKATVENIEQRASGVGVLDATNRETQVAETDRLKRTIKADLNLNVLHAPTVVSLAGNSGNSPAEQAAATATRSAADRQWNAENSQFERTASAALDRVNTNSGAGQVENAIEDMNRRLAAEKRTTVEAPHQTDEARTERAFINKANKPTGDDVVGESRPALPPAAPGAVAPGAGIQKAPLVEGAPAKGKTPAPGASASPTATGSVGTPVASAAPAETRGNLSVAESRVSAAGVTGGNVLSGVAPLEDAKPVESVKAVRTAAPVKDASFDSVSVPERKPVMAVVTDSRPVAAVGISVANDAVPKKEPVALARLQKAGALPKDVTFESVASQPVTVGKPNGTSIVRGGAGLDQPASVGASATVKAAAPLGITHQTAQVIGNLATSAASTASRTADPVPVGATPQRRNNPAAKSVPTMGMSAGR